MITGDSTINLGDNRVKIKTFTARKLLETLKYLLTVVCFYFDLEGSQTHTVCIDSIN